MPIQVATTLIFTVRLDLSHGQVDREAIRENIEHALEMWSYNAGALTPDDDDHAVLLAITVE